MKIVGIITLMIMIGIVILSLLGAAISFVPDKFVIIVDDYLFLIIFFCGGVCGVFGMKTKKEKEEKMKKSHVWIVKTLALGQLLLYCVIATLLKIDSGFWFGFAFAYLVWMIFVYLGNRIKNKEKKEEIEKRERIEIIKKVVYTNIIIIGLFALYYVAATVLEIDHGFWLGFVFGYLSLGLFYSLDKLEIGMKKKRAEQK